MGNLGCCQSPVDVETFREYATRHTSPEYIPYLEKMPDLLTSDYIAGDWSTEDRPTGTGVVFSAEKYFYWGDIVEGRPEGHGTMLLPNHTIFSGVFSENKANGYGQLKFEDEDVSLVGPWKMGYPTFNDSHLLTYKGKKITINFLQREEQPEKEQTDEDVLSVHLAFEGGATYRGDITARKGKVYRIEGKGEMRFADGSYYVGSFQDGKMHGVGSYYWASTGHRYEGAYCDNFRDGTGKYYYNQTNFKEGIWKGGVLQTEQLKSQPVE